MAWIIVLPSKSKIKEFHFLFIIFLDKSCQDQEDFFCQDAIIANYKFLSFFASHHKSYRQFVFLPRGSNPSQ